MLARLLLCVAVMLPAFAHAQAQAWPTRPVRFVIPFAQGGMMETVLNVGLCPATIPGLIKKSGNERFVYDAYRRLIMMYSDVVMEKAAGIEPAEGQGIRQQLERIADQGLRQAVEVAQFGRGEEHGRSVGAGRDAGPASDAGRRIHREVSVLLADEDIVGLGCAAGVDGDVPTRLDDLVEG